MSRVCWGVNDAVPSSSLSRLSASCCVPGLDPGVLWEDQPGIPTRIQFAAGDKRLHRHGGENSIYVPAGPEDTLYIGLL